MFFFKLILALLLTFPMYVIGRAQVTDFTNKYVRKGKKRSSQEEDTGSGSVRAGRKAPARSVKKR